jgi:hypothetical protein
MSKMSEQNQARKIEINTPFGILFAELSGDSDYPGIYICIKQENETDGEYERQLALVECTPNMPNNENHTLRLLAWGKDDIEDYTEFVTFGKLNKPTKI